MNMRTRWAGSRTNIDRAGIREGSSKKTSLSLSNGADHALYPHQITALEEILRLPQACVFINTRYAATGMLMDAGEIVRW
jgi:hypothetical protein